METKRHFASVLHAAGVPAKYLVSVPVERPPPTPDPVAISLKMIGDAVDVHITKAPGRIESGVLIVVAKTDLGPGDYDAVVMLRSSPNGGELSIEEPLEPMAEFIDRCKREHFAAAMQRADGVRWRVARMLGMDPRSVDRMVEKGWE